MPKATVTVSPAVAEVPKLIRSILAARRKSVPLVGVSTFDPGATVRTLATAINEVEIEKYKIETSKATGVAVDAIKIPEGHDPRPVTLTWDALRGLRPALSGHAKSIAAIAGLPGFVPPQQKNLSHVLDCLIGAPMGTVVFIHNAPRFMNETPIMQGIWNLRDEFSVNRRMLVLLGRAIHLPTELEGDVITLDEPLPTRGEVEALIRQEYKNSDLTEPTADVMADAVEATTGLPRFTVSQITAMSMRKAGLDMPSLWDMKRAEIGQTPGLSVWTGTETFDAIGGCDNIKGFLRRLIGGEDSYGAIVFIDEIEKQAAGMAGDNTGISQDQHMQLLAFLEDKKVDAVLLVGHPGVAKTQIAKATGNEAGRPVIQFDLGGMKQSLVGSSEERVRTALKTVDHVSGGRPLFVATCNDLSALSPELRSRFKLGTFFFDLPTADERATIWKIHAKRFELTAEQRQSIAAFVAAGTDEGWTGREIETACMLSRKLRALVYDVAQYIVPTAKAAQKAIDARREQASGRYISAGYSGVYQIPQRGMAEAGNGATRSIDLD